MGEADEPLVDMHAAAAPAMCKQVGFLVVFGASGDDLPFLTEVQDTLARDEGKVLPLDPEDPETKKDEDVHCTTEGGVQDNGGEEHKTDGDVHDRKDGCAEDKQDAEVPEQLAKVAATFEGGDFAATLQTFPPD